MGLIETAAVRTLRMRYEQRRGDVDLKEVLARQPVTDDLELAEVIETDARFRLASKQAVELGRYLEAIPDLPNRPGPLDAAIEYALRWLCPGTAPTAEAAERLIEQHPALEDPIREAVVLEQALRSAAHWESTPAAAPEPPTLPRGFGPKLPSRRPRYLLRKVLGQGSHGTVYLAVDRHLSESGRPAWVAIKVLSGEPTPAARQHLIDEACKARRIDHRNVVRALDWGASESGEVYVVFEYVDGANLDEWLRFQNGRIGHRRAAEMMASIARAVQAAHNAGLVHCDLKPANIIVTASGEPRIADFGVAARETEHPDGAAWPDPVQRIGNLAFIAPEQYRMEEGSLAPPADIYAIGGLLYYLLTGKLPSGDTPEAIGRTHDIAYGRTSAPSLRESDPAIDRDLEAICRRALAPHPRDRYASADALATDLELWLRHEPIPWTRPGPVRKLRLLLRRFTAARRAGARTA